MGKDRSKTVFFCDLDGTLLSVDKTLSEKNARAILRFRDAGGIFIAATGRVIQATRHFFEPLGIDCPVILCNGGMIYDCCENKVMWAEYVPADKAKAMIGELIEKFPMVCAEICCADCIYAININEEERRHQRIGHFEAKEIYSLDEISEEGFSKVLFAMEEAYMKPFAEYCGGLSYACNVEFVSSSRIYHEMIPKNCTKGFAMQKLLDIYGLENCFTAAAGDYSNDIAMLRQADFSACPKNAIDEVKAVCDMVCKADCSNDAVAEIIDNILRS